MPNQTGLNHTESKYAETIIDARANLGEGPIWDAQKQLFYWVNIMDSEVSIYDPSTRVNRIIDVGQYVGTVVPRASGGLMLAVQQGFASLDVETETVTIIHDPEPDQPDHRFNDGKCDPAGRFWAGSMSLSERAPVGTLYCMDTDHSVRKMVENVTISNGLVWSLDNTTMYYIDTPTGTVDAFDYDLATGDIANRRPVITIPEGQGYPDGMTMDAEGMLWVAHWGGARVTRWDPQSGALLDTVHVPAPCVTACAFGGPKLDQLYITSARKGCDEAMLAKYPLSGNVFLAEVGVAGLGAFAFGG